MTLKRDPSGRESGELTALAIQKPSMCVEMSSFKKFLDNNNLLGVSCAGTPAVCAHLVSFKPA